MATEIFVYTSDDDGPDVNVTSVDAPTGGFKIPKDRIPFTNKPWPRKEPEPPADISKLTSVELRDS